MSYLVSGLISTGGRIGSGCPFPVLGFSSFVVDDDASMGGGGLCEFVMIGFALVVCD